MTGTEDENGSILDDGGIDTDARAGRTHGIDLESAPPGTTEDQLAAEREQRLDPAGRPENAEVDNTGRTFDSERGMFTDSADFADAEPRFDDDAEQPTDG